MSSPATTTTLPLNRFPLLDGESTYLRWKESVLLRLHTAGLAPHVLSEEISSAGEKKAATEKWANDDAMCRGYILSAVTDRLLPVYAHHATAAALWRALADTYQLDMDEALSWNKASAFRYDEGKPLLEQLALLQALVTAGKATDSMAYYIITAGFPTEVVRRVAMHGHAAPMEVIWEIARQAVVSDRLKETQHAQAQHTTDGKRSSSSHDFRPLKRERP